MRKLTHYKVSGVLETKPTNLPEGLNVEEVSVELPPDELYLQTVHGESHRFAESLTTEAALAITGLGLFYKPEVVKLRDFLNVVLDEAPKMRVLVDGVNDVWFELQPNLWTQGNDIHCTNPNPWQRAVDRLAHERDALTGQSLEYIIEQYGPVRFIENTWE